jgi:pyruvate dehydrogenase E1 component
MFYREDKHGQVLQEGINEAGAMSSWIAAGTSYSNHAVPTIPFYIFYSMFGWQRTGDQMWALGDQLGRGFLLGATAGRTTLTGEGLQHNDGHSVLLASVSEACVSYDAGWAFELSYIIRDALRRMYTSTPDHPEGENIFYYLTVYNEPYPQPAEPANFPGGQAALERGILRGLYEYAPAPERPEGHGDQLNAQILASGVTVRAALQAQQLLADDWGVSASVWSATSWTELRRDAMAAEEFNLLHPDAEQRVPYVTQALDGRPGPVVAASDWIRAVPDQIARWVPAPYTSLGTDGYGFSDTRAAARRFFHVDAESVTVAVLSQLAKRGEVKPDVLTKAIEKYRLDLPVSEALQDRQATVQVNAPGRPETENQPEVRS